MKHPLSINFKVLEQYDFDKTAIDEAIFFEWLILKRTSFGNQTFFYQQCRITNEIGIKRTRLETLKGIFIDEFGLQIEKGGFNNVTHFTVSDSFIKSFVKVNIKKTYRTELSKSLSSFQFNSVEKLPSFDLNSLEYALDLLNEEYNQRRSIESDSSNKSLPQTQLPVNKKTRYQLSQLLQQYDLNTIQQSFTAYSDAIIRKQDHSLHLLNNFTSYNLKEEKFGVFEHYLEKFNSEYYLDKQAL